MSQGPEVGALRDPDRAEDLLSRADSDRLSPAGAKLGYRLDLDHLVALPQLVVDTELTQPLPVLTRAVLCEDRLVPDVVQRRVPDGRRRAGPAVG